MHCGLGFAFTPPIRAGVFGCVRLCSRFASTPLFLARLRVFGHRFWLYPAICGWLVRCRRVRSGSGFGCAPRFLAGVLAGVCLCACSACTLPFLAGVRGACVSVQFLAFTRPILAEVLGRVSLCAPPAGTRPIMAGL